MKKGPQNTDLRDVYTCIHVRASNSLQDAHAQQYYSLTMNSEATSLVIVEIFSICCQETRYSHFLCVKRWVCIIQSLRQKFCSCWYTLIPIYTKPVALIIGRIVLTSCVDKDIVLVLTLCLQSFSQNNYKPFFSHRACEETRVSTRSLESIIWIR